MLCTCDRPENGYDTFNSVGCDFKRCLDKCPGMLSRFQKLSPGVTVISFLSYFFNTTKENWFTDFMVMRVYSIEKEHIESLEKQYDDRVKSKIPVKC